MEFLLILVFIVGYGMVAMEHTIKVNKAATAMITGVVSWFIYILYSSDKTLINEQLAHHLGELSGILFFLMGAMAIVELIDAHDGFEVITDRIKQTHKVKLLWICALLAFFLSPVLDNLTTAIVMGSLIRKLIKRESDRVYFMGIIVIASNAGGVWSPIGDVTTTMLWIGGQVSAPEIVTKLFFPALTCLMVPLVLLSFRLKGNVERPDLPAEQKNGKLPARQQMIVFVAGILALLMVPVFKTVSHLPPYMGILLGLGVLWLLTEILHGKKDEEDKHQLSVAYALRKIDTPSVFFFFGILICIAALQSAGILNTAAIWMTGHLGNQNLIVLSLGLLSAIVDNVPLVAAVQGMYDLSVYPIDHYFWEFLAYSAGTGGSILIIGSAAGVAAMGIEKISFTWYLKHVSVAALLGFLAGAGVYMMQELVKT